MTTITTKQSPFIDEWNEPADLYDLLTTFYDRCGDYKALEKKIEKLLANPVTYQDDYAINDLQRVIDYRVELMEEKDFLELVRPQFIDELGTLQRQITGILNELGVPSGTLITLHYEGGIIDFWVDEDGKLKYEGM